ncbi:MAG TPA: ankyrin repeat domain-containing protein [Tepidisphaeraceae bacterium]|jgi:ankyrin repeat protein|nr:ankyrin repeat domain-containing protein [Tepidisphaeraceae bacterium]
MFKSLPERPNLDFYRKAARKHLHTMRVTNPHANLAAAQLAIARENGFPSWRKLRMAIERKSALAPVRAANATLEPEHVKAFADALARDRGDIDAIRALLDEYPALANCQPWLPQWPHTAIEAVAHQCVWHRPKMHEIAKLLLERGAVADLPTVARAGLLTEVRKRLDANRSLLNVADAKGRTALYRAACKYGAMPETEPVIAELLRRGAEVDIFTAAARLMIDELESILAGDRGAARAVDSEGLTALHWVTRTDANDPLQVEIASLLLDRGANVDAPAKEGDGMGPLHCAAEWASSNELIELLIDRGADVNARTEGGKGWTPLDFALDRNRAGARDVLRSRNARTRQQLDAAPDASADGFLKLVHSGDLPAVVAALDAEPSLANTRAAHPQWGGRPQALHIAIERGDKPMFDLLLSRGADPKGDNALYDHWSPLMLAIHWKRDDMRAELLQRVDASLIDALMMADDATSLRILQAGAIMLQRAMPNDATMLHFARTPAAAARLLELGVPIGATDKYGKTPLDLAAERGDRPLIDFLIDRGMTASPQTFARLGDLPRLKKAAGDGPIDAATLRAAINSGDEKLVKWVLSRGVDVNQTNDHGATPLHEAAFAGHLPIVKLLVKAGANVHAEDDTYNAAAAGWAQHAAEHLKRTACVEVSAYLEKQMAKKWSAKALPPHRQSHKVAGWKPIMDAAFNGDAAEIETLLTAGADPNIVSTTPAAHRPLHRAIEHKKTAPRGPGHEAAVKALLAGGADPKQRATAERVTALALAAMGSPGFVPLLVEAFQPLDLFHACILLDLPRVKTLLKADPATATARDENGFTPLHYVTASAHFSQSPKHLANQLAIAQLLIDNGADVNATYVWQGGGEWPIPVLYRACGLHDNPALTELLLKAGAQPFDNESVYHAADEGHDASLAAIAKHADKKKLAAECSKCLATQMHWGKSRGAAWLLAHRADPNALHEGSGNSALHSAIIHGAAAKVITMLLSHGADPKLKNRDGQTAIDLAKASSKARLLEQLKSFKKAKAK